MSLRLACADSTFPKLSHEVSLAVIRDLGFDTVDVCSFTGYHHNPPEAVLADPERTAAEVSRRLERFDLAVSDVFVIVGSSFEELAINHPDAAVRAGSLEQFRGFVEFARRLGAPGLTILPGMPFDDAGASLERAAEALNERAEVAGEAGLRLAFEPHYESVTTTPAQALELIERTPDVGFALDYSHFVFQGIGSDEIDPLLARTHHFHARQAASGSMQTRAREGEIDFVRVRDELLGLGYTGYFAVEYQWDDGWLDFTSVDCVSETADMRELLLTGMDRSDR